ncbi:MAG: serine hydrolase [Cytophagales bacterium]|nr:serine hydrolase [Cytophagales bacterium]
MNHSNIKRLLIVFIAITLISCDRQKTRTELSQEQKTAIENLMEVAKIPGIQVGYFNAEEEFIFSSGFANLGSSLKVADDTPFRANDLGYSVIAAICFRLAEENQLDLNQTITTDYLDPRLATGTYNHLITYNHLLSHTSGLPIWADTNDVIEIIQVPGELWNYSHLGFEWIMRALEAKFNTSIQALADQWVFQPLKITNSFFGDQKSPKAAVGHDLIGRNRNSDKTNVAIFYTNAGDYMKILNAFSNDFFKPETKNIQTQTLAKVSLWEDETEESLVSWGPGLGIQSGTAGPALWQYSDEQTMRSFAIVFPQSQTGFVLLTNSENGLAISKSIAQLFFEENLAALNWLDFESYDHPEWQARRNLESAFAFRDQEKAQEVYSQILINQPEALNDALMNNVIWSFIDRNELNPAERLARLHLENFPNTANTYIRLGEILGFKSEYIESWESYQKAMEMDPESSRQIMPRFPWYNEATQAMQESQELPLALFTGAFENSIVELVNDQLTYSDDHYQNAPLKRIGNTLFDLEVAATYRINFKMKNGQTESLEKSHLSGERTTESKKSI